MKRSVRIDGNGRAATTRGCFSISGSCSMVVTYQYDAFGIEFFISGTSNSTSNFCGEVRDQNIETVHLRAREYRSDLGRMLSLDSFEGQIADQSSLHKYSFAKNDPVQFVDPSGNESVMQYFLRKYGAAAPATDTFKNLGASGEMALEFNAFIHEEFGEWNFEPASTTYLFRGDMRGFGEEGTHRLGSLLTVEKSKLGSLTASDIAQSIGADNSHQKDSRTGEVINRKASSKGRVRVLHEGASVVVEVTASAGYPFPKFGLIPSPDIDFQVRWSISLFGNSLRVKLSGTHDMFPYYEGMVDNNLIYKYVPIGQTGPGLQNLNWHNFIHDSETSYVPLRDE